MAGFLVSGFGGFLVSGLVLSGRLFVLILLLFGFGGWRFARIASLRGYFGVYGGSFGFLVIFDFEWLCAITVAVLVIWWFCVFVCLDCFLVFWFRLLCVLV